MIRRGIAGSRVRSLAFPIPTLKASRMRHLLCLAALILSASALHAAAKTLESKPNIVLFLVDDKCDTTLC